MRELAKMSVPAQNMSCFIKSNLRGPSRDCYKASRSSREQRRCPMQQKSPATSKEILEKTSRRILRDRFKLSLEMMCLFLAPELCLWAPCGKSQSTTMLLVRKRCGNGCRMDQPRQSGQSAALSAPSKPCTPRCSHSRPLRSCAELTLHKKGISEISGQTPECSELKLPLQL